MHLYVVTRGNKPKIDIYIDELLAQKWPYPGKTWAEGWIQLGVRPIQLWEMAFPKDYLKTVLSTVCPGWDNLNKKMPMGALNMLRIPLKAKPIPKMDLRQEPRRLILHEMIGIYPFGIREDKLWEKGNPFGDKFIGAEQL